MKPQPKSFPITETTIGFSRGAQIRGVTELYFPSKFESIKCVVNNLKYELANMQQFRLTVDFYLIGNKKDFSKMYDEEEWKMKTTEHFFENIPGEVPKFNLPVPVFGLMLSKYLSVSSAKLTVDKENKPVAFDQTPDILVLPNSYPPLCELPINSTYSYGTVAN